MPESWPAHGVQCSVPACGTIADAPGAAVVAWPAAAGLPAPPDVPEVPVAPVLPPDGPDAAVLPPDEEPPAVQADSPATTAAPVKTDAARTDAFRAREISMPPSCPIGRTETAGKARGQPAGRGRTPRRRQQRAPRTRQSRSESSLRVAAGAMTTRHHFERKDLAVIAENKKATAKELSDAKKIEANTSGTRLLNLWKKRLVKRVEDMRSDGKVW